MTYRKEFWKLQFTRIGALIVIAAIPAEICGWWKLACTELGFSGTIVWVLFYFTQKELVDNEKQKLSNPK